MAVNTKISYAMAAEAANAMAALFDDDDYPGYIEIRTGAPPANVDDAPTGTLLATLGLPNPVFGAAADQNPGARITANAIDPQPATDTGDAGWFRAYNGAGVARVQGTVGTLNADMIVTTVSFVASVNITVVSWYIQMPEGA